MTSEEQNPSDGDVSEQCNFVILSRKRKDERQTEIPEPGFSDGCSSSANKVQKLIDHSKKK